MKIFSNVLTFSLINLAVGCPSGWMTHDTDCYLFSHDMETWIGALQFCREFGAYLVEINDARENAFLQTQAKALKHDFWIGLSDVEEEGNWIWMTSKTRLTSSSFSDWHAGQPNNYQDNENCAHIYRALDYQWNDFSCDSPGHYICEKLDASPEVVG